MSDILQDLDGVICHMDDVLIFRSDKQEQDRRVCAVLDRLRDAGVTLNKKCEFSVPSIKYLGHIVSAKGIAADPDKIAAIRNFPPSTDVSGVRRFLGMVNQLSKFIPGFADKTAPLCVLLKALGSWSWADPPKQAFEEIKSVLNETPTSIHYDSNLETVVYADSSSFGLGAVLKQKRGDKFLSVAYASRSLSSTKQRYSQIEKEALAATWACEKFRSYLIGLSFILHADHSPLVGIFGKKSFDKLLTRLQRFRMRLM